MSKDTEGPAFPRATGGECRGYSERIDGMSLRDYFAAKASDDDIKSEVNKQKHDLIHYLARLEEHSGTKAVCKKLGKGIASLETWQRS